jgi:hypothetical protein
MDTNATTPAMALKAALREMRCCAECASAFRPIRSDQKFCRRHCLKIWHGRAAARGGQIYTLIMEWRRSRGKIKFGDVTAMIDKWIAEDRERTDRYNEAVKELTKAQKA